MKVTPFDICNRFTEEVLQEPPLNSKLCQVNPADPDTARLHQALAQMEAVFDRIPLGLSLLGCDGRYVRVNRRLAEINGIAAEAHIGRTPAEIVPALASWIENLHGYVMETGESLAGIEAEGETPADPGVIHVFRENWFPLRNAEGKAHSILIVVEDVTDHARARRRLAEYEVRLMLALSASATGMWDYDLATGAVSWSAATYDVLGAGSFDGRAESFWPRVHPEDRERVMATAHAAAENRSDYVSTYRIIRDDGGVRLIQSHGRVILDASGQAVRLLGTLTDITGQAEMLNALQKSESRLAVALRAGNLGCYDWNLGPPVQIHWDATCRAIWGVSAEEPVTEALFWRGIHPDDVEIVTEATALAYRPDGPRRYECEYRILAGPGKVERWLHADADVSFEGRHPVRLTGTVQDITARKRLEERMRQMAGAEG